MTSIKERNVYYLGVGKFTTSFQIVFSHATEIANEKDVIDVISGQSNFNIQPGKHYHFTTPQADWHLCADDSCFIYILLTKKEYPIRVAHTCLNELQRGYTANRASNAKKTNDLKLLTTLLEKYEKLEQIDKLSLVTKKVEDLKLVMNENIRIALENVVKLEDLELRTENLLKEAGIFNRTAKQLRDKMWWTNMKTKLIIALILLAIIGIIVGVCVAMSQNK